MVRTVVWRKKVEKELYMCESCDSAYGSPRDASDCERLPAKDFGYSVGQELPMNRFGLKATVRERYRKPEGSEHVNWYKLVIDDGAETKPTDMNEANLTNYVRESSQKTW